MKCDCGFVNRPGAKYCNSCGKSLEPLELGLQQILNEAQEAFVKNDYTTARERFRAVREQASPRSDEHVTAVRYLKHLGESSDNPSFQLLSELQRVQDTETPDEQLMLVQRAIVQGLEFDLRGRDLIERRNDLEQERTDRADQAVQELLNRVIEREKVAEALASGRQALSDESISQNMRERLEGRVQQLEKRAEAADIEGQVRALLELAEMTIEDYRRASDQIVKAQELAPDDPSIAKLRADANQFYGRAQNLEQSIADAREQLSRNPSGARELYERAEREAQDLKLLDLARAAKAGQREGKKAIEDRIAQAQEVVERGKQAQKAGDLSTAESLFQQALDLAGPATDAEQRLESVRRTVKSQSALDKLQRDAQDAQNQFDYSGAIRHLRDALSLAQGLDPALARAIEERIQQLEQKRDEAQEILTTIKLQILPYHTPDELEQQENDIQDKVGSTGLQSVNKLFQGQAASKLRLYLETAWKQVDAGALDAACAIFEEAKKQWSKYFNNRKTVVLGNIPALDNRLKILQAQLDDVGAARDAYQEISPRVEKAEQALQEGRCQDGLADYTHVLDEFPAWPRNVQYVLGDRRDRPGDGVIVGVLGRLQDGFAAAARRYAREQKEHLEHWYRQAKAAFRIGTPEGLQDARQIVEEQALPVARQLYEYKRRHNAFVSEDQRAAWTIQDWVGPFEELQRAIERTLNLYNHLDAGQQFLDQGDHVRAEDAFSEALKLAPDSVTAHNGLERVSGFTALHQQLDEAQSRRDVVAQDQLIRDILKLIPTSAWARDYRKEQNIDHRLKIHHQIQRDLKEAQKLVDQGRFDAAQSRVKRILEQDSENEQALALQHRVTEGEEGIQRLRELRRRAREAFSRGEFSEAVRLAGEVLADAPNDGEASTLHDKAELATSLEKQAAAALRDRKYPDAERWLRQVRDMEGVEAVSDRHRRWQDEIDDKQTEKREMDDMVRDMKDAHESKNWIEALKHSQQVLSKVRGHVDAGRVVRGAKRALRQQIQSAIESREPEALRRGSRVLQDLERYFPDEAGIKALREELKCVSHLVEAKSFLARPSIELDRLNDLVQGLDRLYADWSHEEVLETYNEARYQQLIRQAEQAEKLLNDPARAIQALKEALNIRQEPEVERRYRHLALQAALEESKRLLMAGELHQARNVIFDYEDDKRVLEQLDRIRRFDEAMGEVKQLRDKGDHCVLEITRKLDALLSDLPNFQPAREARQQIVDDLRARGQSAEQTDLWEAKRLYGLLEQIAPAEAARSNLGGVSQKLAREVEELSARVKNAIDRPENLETSDCDNLIKEIERIPESERDRTLRTGLDDLKRYKHQIAVVKQYQAQAEARLQEAYHNKNKYTQATNELQLASVDERGRFSTRETLRQLRERIVKQKAAHEEIERRATDYTSAMRQVLAEASPLEGDNPADLQKRVHAVLDEARHLITQALAANERVRELDPKNLYGMRQWWDENEPDPLDEEHRQFELYKANIETIGSALLNGLALWCDAQERQAQTIQAAERLTRDEEYERVIGLWKQVVELCQQAREKLKAAASQEPQTPRAQILGQVAERAQKPVEELESHGSEQGDHFDGKWEELQEAFEIAEEAYRDAGNRAEGRKAVRAYQAALDEYERVLNLNAGYEPARERRIQCQRAIERCDRPSRWWVYALSGLGIMLISFLGWFFSLGPGSAPPPNSPTPPTPTQGLVTTTPTLSPTSTPSIASPTPTTPSRTPTPTWTPRPTVPPRICYIYNAGNAWARAEPDTRATGTLLRRGTELNVIDTTADGKWYQIDQPIKGWVRVIEITCPESP